MHRVGGVLDQFIARSEDGDAAVLQDAVVQSGVAGGRDDEERRRLSLCFLGPLGRPG